MCLQCYINLTIADTVISKQTNLRFHSTWCHFYTRKITEAKIGAHWDFASLTTPFVAYCTEMNQCILFFHLCYIHGACISEVHEEGCQRPSRSPIWMYLLDLLHSKFKPNHLLLWSTEFHSYGSSWKHVGCLTEACVRQDELWYL